MHLFSFCRGHFTGRPLERGRRSARLVTPLRARRGDLDRLLRAAKSDIGLLFFCHFLRHRVRCAACGDDFAQLSLQVRVGARIRTSSLRSPHATWHGYFGPGTPRPWKSLDFKNSLGTHLTISVTLENYFQNRNFVYKFLTFRSKRISYAPATQKKKKRRRYACAICLRNT